MVSACSAYGCTSNRKKNSDCSFHRFPLNNPDLLALWLKAIRRADFTPGANSSLCSMHFRPRDYQLRPFSDKPLLRTDAVPSVFNFDAEVTPWSTKRKLSPEPEPEPDPAVQSEETSVGSIDDRLAPGKNSAPESIDDLKRENKRLQKQLDTVKRRLAVKEARLQEKEDVISQLRKQLGSRSSTKTKTKAKK